MFNGIVEMVGKVQALLEADGCFHLKIAAEKKFDDLRIGDSIAINGVCLTITNISKHGFSVTVVPETLRITTFQDLKLGDIVNLERAMKFNGRLGGHFVQGHVDFVGEVLKVKAEGEAQIIYFSYPSLFAKYLVNKGYITLDGMSITIIAVEEKYFTVTIIPHTKAITVAKQYHVGSKVNVELDILGKYIEKALRVS